MDKAGEQLSRQKEAGCLLEPPTCLTMSHSQVPSNLGVLTYPWQYSVPQLDSVATNGAR